MKGQKNCGKGYATIGRAQRWNFPRSGKTDTVNNKDGVYEFDGTVTMLLRVVAPQTPKTIDEILRRPPNPNLFLASLSESRGRDSS